MLIILSVLLMIMDLRSISFRRYQADAAVIATPLQYLANLPPQIISWINATVTTQHQVLEENAQLRAEQLLLQAKLQRVVALESENAQLRALLQSSPHVGGRYSVAQLLAVDMDPYVQKVILDRGTRDNVYIGQPVLDAYGVMGQVVKVGPMTSEVLLITDSQSAISVQNSRNGIRTIAAGTGDGSLQLSNVPDTTDIQQGDLMVTSGLDQRFPQGYPLGVVKKIARDPELRFATITLQPSAHIDRSRMILLVWPNPTTDNPVTNPNTPNTQPATPGNAKATNNPANPNSPSEPTKKTRDRGVRGE